MYTNKVCVKVNCFQGFSYSETIKGIKEAGFKYVELSTSKGNSFSLAQDSPSDKLAKLKKDLADNNITPIALSGNSCLVDDDTSKILANIKLAKYFGCKYVDTTISKDVVIQKSDKEIIDRINFYLPYLEENDLYLVIELHGDHVTGRSLKAIVEKVEGKRVFVNYDTGNALFWGKLNVEEMVDDFKACVDYVSFMHIKDKLGELTEYNFPAIGKGYIPFEDILKILEQHQNKAVLAVEIEFTPEGVKDVEVVNKALIDSGEYLKSLGLDL